MARKANIMAVVLLVVSIGLFAEVARAQVQSCKTYVSCAVSSLYYAWCAPTLPLGVYNCVGSGPWSVTCDVPTYLCSPEPCPTCGTARASGPIDLATGNTYIEQSDVRIPGLGGGLALTRRWNSQTLGYGMFGVGWTSNVEEKIYVGGDHLVKNLRGDGSIWSYGYSSGVSNGNVQYLLAGPRNGDASAQLSNSAFTITLKSGEQKTFDPVTGHLLSSADRNGNTTLFSYNSSNQLATVTDPASRHLYFTYSQVNQFSVVTAVTSDFGISVSYQYDGLARLLKVTAADGTFVTFSYTPANLVTTVLDMNGKTLEAHTYDSLGRGLTASRAGGVNAVSVSYSY